MSTELDSKFTKLVSEPYNYITSDKGKEVRVKMIEAFNQWTELTSEQLEVVKSITQKLHNASLLIDDIEDSSLLRRGKPCAHVIYGTPTVINSANYIYFEALNDTIPLGMDALKVFTDELCLLHIGQGMDIHWRDHHICPTEDEYLHMVQQKTGGLFRLAIGLMQCSSKKNIDLIPLVNSLSVLFQILDDYLNLQSNTYHTNKSYAEDISEGKFSFPIIHHLKNPVEGTNDRAVLNILKQRTKDVDLKKHVIECLEKTKSFHYTKEVLKRYESIILKQIEGLGGNVMLEKIISALLKQMAAQDSSSVSKRL